MGICHIVGAAPGEISLLPQKGDLVIAADGGYDSLVSAWICPDWVVGDFDSISGREAPNIENTLVFPSEKDYTDSALAARLGEEKGYRKFVFHRCTGGSLDHTLANIAQIYAMAKRGLRAVMPDGENCLCAVTDGMIEFEAAARGKISIFSLSEEARGVYLKGLYYELKNYRLTSDNALGVRNEFKGVRAVMSVERGTLMAYTALENVLSFSDYFAGGGSDR